MAVAVNTTISVVKPIPAGIATNYVNVSLYCVFGGISTRYDVAVVNATLTTAGSFTATGVAFSTVGYYSCTFSSESIADLDTSGVIITPLITQSISVVSLETTVTFQ